MAEPSTRLPRLGFLGVGWIGRHRMQAILDSGHAEAAVLADRSAETLAAARQAAPHARVAGDLEEMLTLGLDGIVIATPSALHAEQSILALNAGHAVFCQKPLGRTAAEVRGVIDAARLADRLLAVDLSYRFTRGMKHVRELIQGGELGKVFAVDLVFHNAYGPDKPWFYDPVLSGGGCVMDLGVHLVDLALWALDFPRIADVSGQLRAHGQPVDAGKVEDYAAATIQMEDGTLVRLACSWRLQAGCDARIEAAFYGTGGGAALRNVGGSFYDFVAERYRGTAREELAVPPDDWGGRAAVDWAMRLGQGMGFDPRSEQLATVAEVLDGIYGRR